MKTVFSTICIFLTTSLFAQVEQANMPWIDVSSEKNLQKVISEGSESLYNGHPTTVIWDDSCSVSCVWSSGHGGKASFIAESKNCGADWSVRKTPSDWESMKNCPSIYRLSDKNGKERLFVFCQEPKMGYSYSLDKGKTWSAVASLSKPCVMAFSSIVRLKNGDYMGFYHRGYNDHDVSPLTLWSSISKDGGLTWGESRKIGAKDGYSPCEPCVFRSKDGKELVCIARENNRVNHSLIMFSKDEGQTWTDLKESVWGLTGDRHVAKYLKDGRLFIAFRDMAPNSPTKGHFVAWIGTYKDLKEGTSGQYRIKLLHSFAGSDCGYPGVEVLADGSILAVTYIKYRPGKNKHSIVAVRLNIENIDNRLK